MSSGSTKELSRLVVNVVAKQQLPLPEELVSLISAYIEKHTEHDDAYYNRLLEELLNIYQANVHGKIGRFAPFLAVLRELDPLIVRSGRLLQWWERFSPSLWGSLLEEKGLAQDVRTTVLDWLLHDDDDENEQDALAISAAVAEDILSTWLARWNSASTDFNSESKFLESQLQQILMAFGRKRPQDLLRIIDKSFVRKDSRIGSLTLLCEFVRHQPPHLHLVLQTDLFEDLLRCLQTDTSTRVISLAMTALIMFLPHIPNDLPPRLPALFNIYSRMLFWDRERKLEASSTEVGKEASEVSSLASDERKKTWAKMAYMLDSGDESVPELLHYFTFLYGLYPINFMSYIRKPQRYLRHANFPAADDIEIESEQVHQRSERFRQVHLLHPNMFTMTIEAELADNNRWIRSESGDVVAECMALYHPTDGHDLGPTARTRASTGLTSTLEKTDPNVDIPEQFLLEQGQRTQEATPAPSRHPSWRHTGSTAVASPDEEPVMNLFRNPSQTSQSLTSNADSPSVRSAERKDSPTLPPAIAPSASQTRLDEMLKQKRPSRVFHLSNDSVHSFASQHQENVTNVDAYLQSLQREPPRSPSWKSSLNGADPTVKIAYLQREIILLKNDLNFERYLKQQHLSHISKLRRKQIQEARVEAETQNLINSNRTLKGKLDESKRANAQLKREHEKSRSNSRNYEATLTTKLKAFKEQSKTWDEERSQLHRDLANAKVDVVKLKEIVLSIEAREEATHQKLKGLEIDIAEAESLRAENIKLAAELTGYEEGEQRAQRARETEQIALKNIEILTMRLSARETELLRTRKAVEEAMATKAQPTDDSDRAKEREATRSMLDGALASSRNRIVEIQKAHNHLRNRYAALQSAHLDLQEKYQSSRRHKRGSVDEDDEDDEPLLSGGSSSVTKSPTDAVFRLDRHKLSRHALKKAETFDGAYNATSPLAAPGKEDFSVQREGKEKEKEKEKEKDRAVMGMHFHGSTWKLGVGKAEEEGEGDKGLQSPTKKDKESRKERKKEVKEKEHAEDKKDKKSGGSRMLRGFG